MAHSFAVSTERTGSDTHVKSESIDRLTFLLQKSETMDATMRE